VLDLRPPEGATHQSRVAVETNWLGASAAEASRELVGTSLLVEAAALRALRGGREAEPLAQAAGELARQGLRVQQAQVARQAAPALAGPVVQPAALSVLRVQAARQEGPQREPEPPEGPTR
jgi:hypothetical protein